MATQAKRDYYEVLGVPSTATAQDISSAFESLASKFQSAGKPRNIDDVEEIRAIATAYRVLSNEEKRRRYDKSGLGFIGNQDNRLAGPGPDKLDDTLKQFEDLYKRLRSLDSAF
ncbi:MAG TPA: DnaJ domain-containing protein [Candidatus Angelobacter sp.]|nr:DnaJ domain-containing protein [Candidatus Angelobacter sp.]